MILEKEFQEETGWKKEPVECNHFKITSPNSKVYSHSNGLITQGAFLYYFDYANWLEKRLKNKNK